MGKEKYSPEQQDILDEMREQATRRGGDTAETASIYDRTQNPNRTPGSVEDEAGGAILDKGLRDEEAANFERNSNRLIAARRRKDASGIAQARMALGLPKEEKKG